MWVTFESERERDKRTTEKDSSIGTDFDASGTFGVPVRDEGALGEETPSVASELQGDEIMNQEFVGVIHGHEKHAELHQQFPLREFQAVSVRGACDSRFIEEERVKELENIQWHQCQRVVNGVDHEQQRGRAHVPCSCCFAGGRWTPVEPVLKDEKRARAGDGARNEDEQTETNQRP